VKPKGPSPAEFWPSIIKVAISKNWKRANASAAQRYDKSRRSESASQHHAQQKKNVASQWKEMLKVNTWNKASMERPVRGNGGGGGDKGRKQGGIMTEALLQSLNRNLITEHRKERRLWILILGE